MARTRNEYLDFLMDHLAPLGAITARAMFGGHCLYCDGAVFALVADGVLYLKADAQTRPRFERLGLHPFRPYEDRAEVMQYYPPPPEFFEDPEAVLDWGGKAVAAGRRARSARTRTRRAVRQS